MRKRLKPRAVIAALLVAGCAPRTPSLDAQMARYLAPVPPIGDEDLSDVRASAAPVALNRGDRQPYVERGGLRIRTQAPTAAAAPAAGGEMVELNFPNADIREFAAAVLGGILGLSYAVDTRIEGTVTLETQGPVPRDQVLTLVEQVLQMHGAALVPMPGGYQVVPLDRATDYAVGLDAGAGFGVRIVPLRNLSTETAAELLTPFAEGGTRVQADADLNALLIAGPHSRTQALASLVQSLDVDRLRGLSIALYPLRYAAPDALAEDLAAIFGMEEEGPARLVPLSRLGAVAIVSRDPDQLQRLMDWARRLDQEGGGDQPELFVYRAQNARAADLADALGRIYGTGPQSAVADGRIAPGERARRVRTLGAQLSGTATGMTRPSAAGAAAGLAGAPVSASTGQAPDLATGPELAPAATAAFAGPSRDLPDNMRLIADEGRNAVIVYATRQQFRNVEQVLSQLDQVPLQVMIEATIAEVTLNDTLAYGLQWFFESGNFQAILSQTAGTTIVPALPGGAAIFGGADARAVLSALSTITDVRVLSSPQVLSLTNQVASLQVGDSVPVPVQQAVSLEDPDAVIVNSIEFVDTGVSLEVLPRVNDGGLVLLDIVQNVSDAVVTTTSGIDAPTIAQRRIASSVAVRSGETIGLGGLIRDRASRGREGLPLLSSLPAVGALFSTRTLESRRTELLILLTPKVVATPGDARAVTDELRQKMLSMRPLAIPVSDVDEP